MSGIVLQAPALLIPAALTHIQVPSLSAPPLAVVPALGTSATNTNYSYPGAVHALDANNTLVRASVSVVQDSEGTGAYIFDAATGMRYHVTGTDARGRYIGHHTLNASSSRTEGVAGVPGLYVRNNEDMVRLLQLTAVSGQPGRYSREGFPGYYTLQRENDGSVSVFYSGGNHTGLAAGASMGPQTFHHGRWDTTRRTASRTTTESTELDTARAQNRTRATSVGTAMLACTQQDGSHDFGGGVVDRSAGGTAYFSQGTPVTGLSAHQTEGSLSSWEFHAAPTGVSTAISLTVSVPTSSTPVSLAAPAMYVTRTIPSTSGGADTTHGAYVFTTPLHPRSSTTVLADRETVLPPRIREAYQAARDTDGVMLTNVWHSLSGGVRAMVLGNGDVVFQIDGPSPGTKRHVRGSPSFRRPSRGQTFMGATLRDLEWTTEDVVPERDGISFRPLVPREL